MDQFTRREKHGLSSPDCVRFSVSVDAKGRIVLPAEVRKTLGYAIGDKLEMLLSVSGNRIVLKRGDSNVR